MRLFAKAIFGHPALVFSVVAAITVVLAAGLPRLGFDMHPNATFRSNNTVSQNLDRLHKIFGPDDNDIFVLLEGDGLLEPNSLEDLRRFRDQIEQTEGVKFVASLFDVNKPGTAMPLVPEYIGDRFDADQLKRDLDRHPVGANQLVSADGRILTMLIRIRGESLSVSEVAEVVNPLKRFAAEYQEATSAKIHLAGHPAIRMDVLMTLRYAMAFGCLAAIVIGFLIAMLVFRHFPSVVISVAVPAIGTVWTMGLLAWNGVPVSGLMTAIPTLVFVIGLTDAVHLLLEAQRQIHGGHDQRQAAYEAVLRVGPACLLTSITTMLGFGSLVLSSTESVQEFGFWAAVGTSCAMLSVVIVLPIILLNVPREWANNKRNERNSLGVMIQGLVKPTLRRPALTTSIAVALCLILFYPAINQKPDIVWTETMPAEAESVKAMDLADEEFGGAMLAYVMIRWPEGISFPDRQTLEATARIHQLFRQASGFTSPMSIRNLLATTPGDSLAERYQSIEKYADNADELLVSTKDRTLVVSARVPNAGSAKLATDLENLMPELDEVRRQYPDYEFTLTGTAVAAAENMTAIILDLAKSLAVAAGLIFVVLTITFRSLKIGFLTIVPNVLPLLVTAAGLTMVGMPLQITSAMTFSLCLGLAVDDTIHVVVRYLWNLQDHTDRRQAIIETVGHVGPALIVTTTILLGGFAAMMVSPMPGIQLFAALSAVTLLAALIGDLFLFPAMLLWDWNAATVSVEQSSNATSDDQRITDSPVQ